MPNASSSSLNTHAPLYHTPIIRLYLPQPYSQPGLLIYPTCLFPYYLHALYEHKILISQPLSWSLASTLQLHLLHSYTTKRTVKLIQPQAHHTLFSIPLLPLTPSHGYEDENTETLNYCQFDYHYTPTQPHIAILITIAGTQASTHSITPPSSTNNSAVHPNSHSNNSPIFITGGR